MKRKLQILSFGFIAFCFSCQQFNGEDNGHPIYFDKVLKTAGTKLKSDFKNGSRYLDSAYRVFPNTSTYDLYQKYHIQSEYLYTTYQKYTLAHQYIDSGINLLNSDLKKYNHCFIDAYNLKANIFVNQNDFDHAFKYFFLAKSLNEKNQDLAQLAWSNSSLGNVLYQQKKYKDAINYYRVAVRDYQLVESTTKQSTFASQQQQLNNIGLCYEKDNQLDSAKNEYLGAINFINDAELKHKARDTGFNHMAKGIIYGNLGSTYYQMGEYNNAENAYITSLELNKQDEQDALFTKIKLATLFITTKRYTEALRLINELKQISEVSNQPYEAVELRYRELAWTYYDQIRATEKAYSFFKSHHQLKDSLDLVANNLSHKDFNKEFIKLAQEKEISELKEKDEVKNVYLLLTIGLSILAAIIIFLILGNVKLTKRNVKKLTVLNTKISDHNRLMQKTLGALEQSQEENSHLMQVLAHDMRTPIAGVIGLTALMLEEDDLTTDQREILHLINVSGTDTLSFINDLLQVQNKKSNLIKEPVEMHTLLKYCITLLDSRAREKNQQLKITTLPIEINISREKIWRVMSNLISNAIKFSPHGTTITITMEEKPLSILITVKDNGIGIPVHLAAKLFQIDTAVQREGTDGEKSFGLGLAISKQIVEAHNGSIWFESLPGFGTTFFVELPITEN